MIDASGFAGDAIEMSDGRSDGALQARPAPGDGDPQPQPVQAPGADGLVDGLARWDAEDGGQPAAQLEVVRLTQSASTLVLFTTTMRRVYLHYLDYRAIKGYVRCNGKGCRLCSVGRARETRDLLPVYDVQNGAVAILPISPSLRPHALRPQLTRVLRDLAAGGKLQQVEIRSGDRKFLVNVLPLQPGADHGAAAVADFLERLDARHVDLAAAYQRLDDEDLAKIDEVRALMAAWGIRA
jgi:hypothetical protein